jgi:hypothetical protein
MDEESKSMTKNDESTASSLSIIAQADFEKGLYFRAHIR